jgi:hypothetical protein
MKVYWLETTDPKRVVCIPEDSELTVSIDPVENAPGLNLVNVLTGKTMQQARAAARAANLKIPANARMGISHIKMKSNAP